MAAPMSGIRLPNVGILRQIARDELVLRLESISGKKDLFLDANLMRPLDRIAGASLLKEHGVDKIFKLEPCSNPQGSNQRIYLVRPELSIVKTIANQINADKNQGTIRTYKILFVPRKMHICERILEQEGVHGDVIIEVLQLDLIPLDTDLLSLEIPEFFRITFLDNDTSWCHTAAQALVTIQQLFGLIPNVYGQGRYAKMVHGLMKILFQNAGEPKQLNNEIGHMFIFDRDVDYVTPLCSQVTYEGLLDDTFGIFSGLIEFGPEVTQKEQPVKLLLTSHDLIFNDIRDRHFSNVFGFLGAKARELQAGYDKRHSMKSVNDLKNFVANDLSALKQQYKSLTLHIGACEVVLKKKTMGDFEDQLRTEHSILEGVDNDESFCYIEEMISRRMSPGLTLRLMCLLSKTKDGLPLEKYKFLKTQFLQSHGFDYLLTFHNLKRLGLFEEKKAPQSTKPLGKVAANISQLHKSSQFRVVAKKLNLIPKSAEDINLKIPVDMSYVFSGAYTPMLCKIVEQVLSKDSFGGMEEIVKNLAGPNFCEIKAKSVKGSDGKKADLGKGVGSPDPSSARVILVFFLGGCTYSEITALRFLGRLKGYNFVIATTSIINGAGLINNVSDKGRS